MNVIVTDTGFQDDTWDQNFTAANAQHTVRQASSIDLTPDTAPETLRNRLTDIEMIRIDFPNFTDKRGFTIARQLRLMGYQGRLRARGQLIATEYKTARRAGFDEIEISADIAARQPQNHWVSQSRANTNDYPSRLRGLV